ncbi:cellulase family glycosylhydrolase [Chryseolinea serpens]|nr:cellulase family glycosylhydrolase [Chryseolinea serpens]
MKKIHAAWMFMVCLLALVLSCASSDPDPAAELVISTDQLELSKDGETKSFHIKANTDWTLSSAAAWCTVTPTSGQAGTIKIDATAAKNETASERSAAITVTAGGLSKQITITQNAAGLLTVTQQEVSVAVGGQQITIPVQSSGTYAIAIDEDWITTAAGSTLENPKFDVAANAALLSRVATVTFSLNSLTQVVTVTQAGQPLTIDADNAGMASDAMTLAQKMKVGWNLGNTLECTGVTNGVYTASETMWGNPKTTKTLIDGVKAAGFNAVRLPCAWSGYIEDVTTYRIKDAWLARVKEVIDYCVDNDMYVIINIHWDGGWLEEHPLYANQTEVNKKQKALWEQISVYFRDYDEHLLFAGTNEVHANYSTPTTENITVQQSFNQTFVDAVRSTGGKNAWRNLVVQAYNTNITFARDYMTMPTDAAGTSNRLMAEVHFYDPYDFALDASSSKYLWGADYAGNANTSTWGQEAWVDEAFGIVKTKFVNNGIPVILGEYAAILRSGLPNGLADHIKARNHYLNYVTKTAKANGMVPFYWDAGGTGDNSTGLFDRSTGQIAHSDAVDAIVSGAN